MSRPFAATSLRFALSIVFVTLAASSAGCAGVTAEGSGVGSPGPQGPPVVYEGVALPSHAGEIEARARAERIASVVSRVDAERTARRSHGGRHGDE